MNYSKNFSCSRLLELEDEGGRGRLIEIPSVVFYYIMMYVFGIEKKCSD